MYKNKYFKSLARLRDTTKEVSKGKGIFYGTYAFSRILTFWLITQLSYRIFKSSEKTFTFALGTFKYLYHNYNKTWSNERTVEVPIIWDVINKNEGKRILEVGNVLSHYFNVTHEIVDKYEKADGILNQDIVDFNPTNKYDLIVSISTLEHVGWDETPKEPLKILKAIDNLKSCLAPNGKMYVTLLMGYNTVMDDLLRTGEIKFSEKYCLKRISRDNQWKEVKWEDIQDTRFWYPYPNANGLIIGVIKN